MNAGTTVCYPIPYELAISSSISSQVGADLIKSNSGGLLLSGNNSGMAGDLLVEGGVLGFGNTSGNNALGTGMVGLYSGATLDVENGPQTLNNELAIDGNVYLNGSVNDFGSNGAGTAHRRVLRRRGRQQPHSQRQYHLDGANATVNLWMLSAAIITTNGTIGDQAAAVSIARDGQRDLGGQWADPRMPEASASASAAA